MRTYFAEAKPELQSEPRRGAAARLAAALGLLLPLAVRAATVTEDFSSDPSLRGWFAVGDPGLFRWSAINQNLEVVWDTSKAQSLFGFPLGQTLAATNDFSFAFDLLLTEADAGISPDRPGAMQVALGLLNARIAAAGEPRRAAGAATDTLEFDWFPPGFIPGYGDVEPTLSPIAFDAQGRVAASFTFPLTLTTNVTHRIQCAYAAATRTMSVTLWDDGAVGAPVVPLVLPAGFGSFALDTFAAIVWNDSTSQYDSLLARGVVDNVTLELPSPPVGVISMIAARPATVRFVAQAGLEYWLQASDDMAAWADVGGPVGGTNGGLQLVDPRQAVRPVQYYRVRSSSP